LAEWEVNKEEEDREFYLMEEQEEVVEEADEGKLLVLRRAFSGLKGGKEEQRENIFHSKCTVQGKVCSLIIDGGSCANVASFSMVEKLNLQAMAQPHSYNIQWLNQGKGLQVNSRCLIFCSIGKSYHDELWCDIIPIDACHILLGRPWLFDRKVIHHGYLNTYSFSKDGKKITLAPIQPSKPLKPQKGPQKILLLTLISRSNLATLFTIPSSPFSKLITLLSHRKYPLAHSHKEPYFIKLTSFMRQMKNFQI